MAQKPLTPEVMQAAVDALATCGGNQSQAADTIGVNRGTFLHRVKEAQRAGISARVTEPGWTFAKEAPLWIDMGTVVVFSDAHFNPGPASLAHRALIEVIKHVQPRAVVANGDIFDGGSIGRHPVFGFAQRPTPVQELEACIERMHEIELARPNGCELIYTVGNHDIRWERTLATQADKFAGLFGLRLSDHFPQWDIAWSCPVNWEGPHPVMIKHRIASGIHAGYSGTIKAGVTTVTGHTHQLDVKFWGDYRGRRYGIQTGSLADLESASFEYTENGPSPACSGFVVLTFHEGELLVPEICQVTNGRAWFRGRVVAE